METIWKCRGFSFPLGQRTLVMGIVNVTPDSFSDGGRFASTGEAIRHALQLFDDGADMVDIGGESSRPGAAPVPAKEECGRVIPVVKEIAQAANMPVSIDTVKYEVADQALAHGACVINDISGLQREPRLASLAASSGAGLAIMHMRGTPATMQSQTGYSDLLAEISSFFREKTALALDRGIKPNQICIDPGIGFSKTAEQNLSLIKRLAVFRDLNYPILLGVSRKSFIGKISGQPAAHREFGSAAAAAIGVWNGANIIRAHDVKAARDAVDVVDAIRLERIVTEHKFGKGTG